MVGKRLLLVVTMVLALPIVAMADSDTIFTNTGGILTGTNAGLSLTGSTLIGRSGPDGTYSGSLGTVSFSTGAMSSGSLQSGGTFESGGSFTITGNGSNGIATGVLFSGAFTQAPVWTMSTVFFGTHQYTLTGVLAGNLSGAGGVSDVNVTLIINTGKGFFNAAAPFYGGTTVTTETTPMPEPDSWALLATAVLGIAVVFPRKWKLPSGGCVRSVAEQGLVGDLGGEIDGRARALCPGFRYTVPAGARQVFPREACLCLKVFLHRSIYCCFS
jgi:hypothetical protein